MKVVSPRIIYAEVPLIGLIATNAKDNHICRILREGTIYEEALLKFMLSVVKEGDRVIDGGAFIGSHSLPLSKAVGKKGVVYSFEPRNISFDMIMASVLANDIRNIELYQYGLDEKEGFGYIRQLDTEEGNYGGIAVVKDGNSIDRIELRSIDSFGFDNVKLIKLDIEGYELSALKGAKETISKSSPVIVFEILDGSMLPAYNKFFMDIDYVISKNIGRNYIANKK